MNKHSKSSSSSHHSSMSHNSSRSRNSSSSLHSSMPTSSSILTHKRQPIQSPEEPHAKRLRHDVPQFLDYFENLKIENRENHMIILGVFAHGGLVEMQDPPPIKKIIGSNLIKISLAKRGESCYYKPFHKTDVSDYLHLWTFTPFLIQNAHYEIKLI